MPAGYLLAVCPSLILSYLPPNNRERERERLSGKMKIIQQQQWRQRLFVGLGSSCVRWSSYILQTETHRCPNKFPLFQQSPSHTHHISKGGRAALFTQVNNIVQCLFTLLSVLV